MSKALSIEILVPELSGCGDALQKAGDPLAEIVEMPSPIRAATHPCAARQQVMPRIPLHIQQP